LKKIFNEVLMLPDFQKDLIKLEKNYSTLKQDLKVFVKIQLRLFHKLNIDNEVFFTSQGFLLYSHRYIRPENSPANL